MRLQTPQQIREMNDFLNDCEARLKSAHKRNQRRAEAQNQIETESEVENEHSTD